MSTLIETMKRYKSNLTEAVSMNSTTKQERKDDRERHLENERDI